METENIIGNIEQAAKYARHFIENGPRFSATLYFDRAKQTLVVEKRAILDYNPKAYAQLSEEVSELEKEITQPRW